MGLADDLLAPANLRKGPPCAVNALIERLEVEDPPAAEAFVKVLAMHTSDMPSSTIVARLRDSGYVIGRESVQRHRRRVNGTGCACPT